jgi:hypothetical protein
MAEHGLQATVKAVPQTYYGNFNTKQRAETYEFFTFRKSQSTFPVME